MVLVMNLSRPCEKSNIIDSAESIDTDHPKPAAEDNPDRLFSPPVEFLLQESLLYTSISMIRNVSAQISLRGLRSMISVRI